MKTLTENLKVWRKERNISKADYLVFVGNILEELLEVTYTKNEIEAIKTGNGSEKVESLQVSLKQLLYSF